MTRQPRNLTEAVDQAIAAENRAVEATLCRGCAGTGTIYFAPPQGGTSWRPATCPRCHGTGLRKGVRP